MFGESSKKKRLGWGPGAAVFVVVLAFIAGEILGGAIVGVLAGIADALSIIRLNVWVETVPAKFLFVLASSVVTMLGIWLFLRHRRASMSDLGFKRRPRWSDVGWSVAAFPLYLLALAVVAAAAEAFVGVNVRQEQELGFSPDGAFALIFVFASLVILPPLIEEILFRGFLYTGLRSRLTIVWATLITSVLFAIPHLFASSEGLLWIAAIDTFLLSIAMCYLRERTGNLWAPIVLHALKNGTAFLFVFVFAS